MVGWIDGWLDERKKEREGGSKRRMEEGRTKGSKGEKERKERSGMRENLGRC